MYLISRTPFYEEDKDVQKMLPMQRNYLSQLLARLKNFQTFQQYIYCIIDVLLKRLDCFWIIELSKCLT